MTLSNTTFENNQATLVIVPLVSLVTPSVPFEIDPPHSEGAIDREYARELQGKEEFSSNEALQRL